MKHVILKCLVGSNAYGTNIEGSDRDYKGVFVQDPEDVLEVGYQEQYSIGKDETYYEIRRFADLAAKGNPTMLELLFMPEDCVLYKHPVMDQLLNIRHEFLSKSCRHSFVGYAHEQVQKAGGLDKKMNWEKEKTIRKTVLDFCWVLDPDSHFKTLPLRKWLEKEGMKQEHCGLSAIEHFRYTYNLFYDHVAEMRSTNPRFSEDVFKFKGVVQDEDNSNDISLSDIPKYALRATVMFFNKDAYSTHCKDYLSYQKWLEERNTQRYVDVQGHGQSVDGKNLLHCVRLIETGIEIARKKDLIVRRPNAQFLVDIRKGKYDLKTILVEAEKDIKTLNEAYDKSDLPDHADRGKIMKTITKMRKDLHQSLKDAKTDSTVD